MEEDAVAGPSNRQEGGLDAVAGPSNRRNGETVVAGPSNRQEGGLDAVAGPSNRRNGETVVAGTIQQTRRWAGCCSPGHPTGEMVRLWLLDHPTDKKVAWML